MKTISYVKSNTKQDYEAALERFCTLMQLGLADNSPELNKFEALSLLIKYYRDKHYLVTVPSPIDTIIFKLEQLGKAKNELEKILGTRVRQAEILSGKRRLSLEMIRKLYAALRIPAESLTATY